jgi:hypothetical protein
VATWTNGTDEAVVIYPGAEAGLRPASDGEGIDYDGILSLTNGVSVVRMGADDWGTPFRFRVQRFP